MKQYGLHSLIVSVVSCETVWLALIVSVMFELFQIRFNIAIIHFNVEKTVATFSEVGIAQT